MSEIIIILEFAWTILVRVSLCAAIVFPIAWLVCYFAQKLPRQVHCWIWRLAYLKVIAASVSIAPIVLPILPASYFDIAEPVANSQVVATGNIHSGDQSPIIPFQRTVQSVSWQHLVVVVWLVGFVFFLLRFCQQVTISRNILTRGVECDCNRVLEIYRKSAEAISVFGPPRVLQSDDIDRPALIGVINPAVVVPSGFTDRIDAEELSLVFRHELAHLKRKDLLWNFIPQIVNLALYFHPLAWVANRRWAMAMESACDELVLQIPDTNTRNYASTLIRVAELISLDRQVDYCTLSVVSSFRTLRERILTMHCQTQLSRSGFIAVCCCVLLVAIVSIVPWKLESQKPNARFVNGDFEADDLSAWEITAGPNAKFKYDRVTKFDIDYQGPREESRVFALSVGQISNEPGVYRYVDICQSVRLTASQQYEIGFDWAVQNFFFLDNHDGGVFEVIVDDRVLTSIDSKSIYAKNIEMGMLRANFTADQDGLHRIGARIGRRYPIPLMNDPSPTQLQYVDNFYVRPINDQHRKSAE